MKKTIGVLAFGLLSAAMVFATTANKAPEKITINECATKKPAVLFPHKAHWAITSCKTCHHTQPDLTPTSTVEVQACATCHHNPEKADTPDCTQMSMTKNPYHMVCLTCHKETKAKDANTKAPTACTGCHVAAG